MRRSFSRTFASRTLNGLSALVPSQMSVAATVRLLLPPVTEAKSLRWPRPVHHRSRAEPGPVCSGVLLRRHIR